MFLLVYIFTNYTQKTIGFWGIEFSFQKYMTNFVAFLQTNLPSINFLFLNSGALWP